MTKKPGKPAAQPTAPPQGNAKALVRGRAVTIAPPTSVDGPPFLIVQIEISCSICGSQEFIVAGHHLRPLVSLFQEFIDAEPELTREGEVEVVGDADDQRDLEPGEQLRVRR